jgi:hypothetical protein
MSNNGQYIFLGTDESNLFLSQNGGTSWTEINPRNDPDEKWYIGQMSSDASTFLAGGIIEGRLYVSPLTAPTQAASSTVTPPGCTNSAPVKNPNLFQIDPAGTYINMYYTSVPGSDGYQISYGLTSDANQFGDMLHYSGPDWILGRTIGSLAPNTVYYFKVRASNGCNTGAFSQTVKVKTKGRLIEVTHWFANLSGHSAPK